MAQKASSKAPVTITAFAPVNQNTIKDITTNTYTRYVEKKYNIKLNWDLAPNTDVAAKASVEIQSGNYPDVFMSAPFTTGQILTYGHQKIFIDLSGLLKKYAPNVLKYINSDPQLKAANVAPDGKIYALSSYNACFHCTYSNKIWINAAKLKQYGLALPTTTAQYEHALKVFKSHGLIPLTGGVGGWRTDPTAFLMNAFTYDPDFGSGAMFQVTKSGKLVFAPALAGWRAGLRYMHRLHAKGLLPDTVFTQNMTSMGQQLGRGKVGSFAAGCQNCLIPTADPSFNTDWVALPPLKGPSGVRYTTFFPSAGASAGLTGGVSSFAITNKASMDQVVPILKMMNEIYTTWGMLYADYGPKPNPVWQFAKKGQKGLTGKQALFNINWTAQGATGANTQNSGWSQMVEAQSRDWFNSYYAPAPLKFRNEERTLHMMTNLFYAGWAPKLVQTPSFWVSPADSQRYVQLQTDIMNYAQQNMQQFIVGTKSLDKDWNSYLSGLKGLNLSQYISMSQAGQVKPVSTADFGSNPKEIISSLKMMSKKQAWEVKMLKTAYKAQRGRALK